MVFAFGKTKQQLHCKKGLARILQQTQYNGLYEFFAFAKLNCHRNTEAQK